MAVVRLMRVKHWVKNGFVLLPLLFSGQLLVVPSLVNAAIACAAFCCLSSCVYIINDILDREKDRNHPVKCNRPLASGSLSVGFAVGVAVVLLICTMILLSLLNVSVAVVLAGYLILNCAYSVKLKHVPIIDIMIVAIGFVLRVVAGAFAIERYVSSWIIFCMFMLALFLAIQKRYGELDASKDTDQGSRNVLQYYTRDLLGDYGLIAAALTIVSYSLYTFSASPSEYMMLTIPFVIYGLFRYQMVAKTIGGVETPEKILFLDKYILIDVLLWAGACAIILYVV